MAVIELIDRNPEAKKVDKPKKIDKKDNEKKADQKVASKQLSLYMPQTYIVEEDYHNTRFDKWFKAKIINLPQSLVEKIIRLHKVKINKKKIKSSYRVQLGDVVEVYNISNFKSKDKEKIIKYKASRKEINTYDDYAMMQEE